MKKLGRTNKTNRYAAGTQRYSPSLAEPICLEYTGENEKTISLIIVSIQDKNGSNIGLDLSAL